MVKLETVVINIDEIYVPAKRRGTLDEAKVETLAESIIEDGHKIPIHVRPDPDKNRYLLTVGGPRLLVSSDREGLVIDRYQRRARKLRITAGVFGVVATAFAAIALDIYFDLGLIHYD